MKRLILMVPLIILAFTVKAQVPFYGDRVFISSDKQDTMTLRFVGDTVYFVSDNGFFKFSKAISVDSIRLKDGKWIKGIVTTETDPRWTADSIRYSSKSYVGKSIKDSLANLKTRFPSITIKPTRDSLNYEMIGGGKSYKIPVTYTIYRPTGSATITAVNLDGKVITPPALNEGATYTGNDTLIFGQSPTITIGYKRTFQFKVVAGKDTVKQDLILGQYWKVYVGPVAYYYGSSYTTVDDYSFNSLQSELLVDGKAFLTNATPASQELMIGIPVEFVNKTIYVNGLPFKFTQYNTRSTNFVNARNAVHQYKGLVSQFKIIGSIQSIEIK